MRLLIRGGRVIDPASGIDDELDVLVEDGRIRRLAALIREGADEVVDARGAWVIPGAIDIHVHLREPGLEHKERIETGTRAAAAGGITAVACMPNTNPAIDTAAIVSHVYAIARAQGLVRVYVIGALTKGRQGQELAEMGEMADAGAVAFSDDGDTVMDASLMRSALLYAAQLGRPVVVHCMDASLARGGVMREGPVATRLGLPGIPAEAESIIVARDIALARATGARLHVAHVSTAESVRLVAEAKASGAAVTAEVTPHHLFLTDEALAGYDASAKVNPPLGTEEDRQALRRALAEGIVDVVASDHAPHAPEEKEAELDQAPFGAVGLETMLALVLGHLVREGVLSPMQAVAAVTSKPAAVLGLPGGRLAEGAVGDITLFDPAGRWEVDPARLHSIGKNTPFAGWRLEGRPVGTVVGGRVVMLEGELLDVRG
ncbi:MAG TPA: dihydroorotase [Limnochordales bacterium]